MKIISLSTRSEYNLIHTHDVGNIFVSTNCLFYSIGGFLIVDICYPCLYYVLTRNNELLFIMLHLALFT